MDTFSSIGGAGVVNSLRPASAPSTTYRLFLRGMTMTPDRRSTPVLVDVRRIERNGSGRPALSASVLDL
jgi:hypothetical protein